MPAILHPHSGLGFAVHFFLESHARTPFRKSRLARWLNEYLAFTNLQHTNPLVEIVDHFVDLMPMNRVQIFAKFLGQESLVQLRDPLRVLEFGIVMWDADFFHALAFAFAAFALSASTLAMVALWSNTVAMLLAC